MSHLRLNSNYRVTASAMFLKSALAGNSCLGRRIIVGMNSSFQLPSLKGSNKQTLQQFISAGLMLFKGSLSLHSKV
jgi:5-keto 4-deoxyuronate isomerase